MGDARIAKLKRDFVREFEPLEAEPLTLVDGRTEAHYCECHIKGSLLIRLGTTDVPLDPDEQLEYRANRELREDNSAFQIMCADAKDRRSFSNIVTEYTKEFSKSHPLKIVGGQHRYTAIKRALADGIDVYHGIKVYFGLDLAQRLDVQLISNTNIATSLDLIDRLQETSKGSTLRDWCQKMGLLAPGQDFADQYFRGGPISVRMARSFILNYYAGVQVKDREFSATETTPVLCETGGHAPEWEALKAKRPDLWTDNDLILAANEFCGLVEAQRQAFGSRRATRPEYPEKALGAATYSAWFFVAGLLKDNPVRLERHFGLKSAGGSSDPLNVEALAAGRHKSDKDNYRGISTRTDPRERGTMVELFYIQAETGRGITKRAIDAAISAWFAKSAVLEANRKRERVERARDR